GAEQPAAASLAGVVASVLHDPSVVHAGPEHPYDPERQDRPPGAARPRLVVTRPLHGHADQLRRARSRSARWATPVNGAEGARAPRVDWPDRLPSGDWRQGMAAVVILTIDVDAESPVLARGEHYIHHLTTMSHQAYGPRV